MKKTLIIALVLIMCSGSAEAQSLLNQLGKRVQKRVTEKVTNAVKQEVRKAISGKEQDGNQSAQPSEEQTTTTPVAKPVAAKGQKPLVIDRGENIERQQGLDYIDEYGINHGGGILIGGILWAPVNCGYHETDYPYGKLYQWGRKHGQGYGEPYTAATTEKKSDKTTAEIVPAPVTPSEALKYPNRFYARSNMASFNWTRNDMSLWCPLIEEGKATKHPKYDPCPEGWRVPELFDFYSLAEHYSDFVEYPEGGPKGRWFSGPEQYSTNVQRIFLPATGMRTRDGESHSRDRQAIYWSLRHGGGEGLVWHLYLNDYEAVVNPSAFPHEAYSVRCIKDIEGQRLR